ncbi:MAG: FmdB family zinc ribbon protein [Desulfomonilia bacterium]
MPIYEYKCSSCGEVTTVFTHGYRDKDDVVCECCGSTDVKRIISAVHVHQSSSERLSSYNPAARQSDEFYKDSRNIGLHAEHMLKKAGVKPTEEFKNKLEKLRTDPSSVIKDSE